MITQIITGLFNNKVTLALLGVASLILITTGLSILKPKRVKVKRRIIEEDSKFSNFIDNVIGKNIFLSKIKEFIRIKLGLTTSKSDVKNGFYATLIIFSILSLFIIAVISTFILKISLMFKFIVLISSILIPFIIISFYIKIKRKKIHSDFPELVSVFIAKYATTRNIKEALKKSIPDLPISLRHEIKRLVNSMNHAESYFKALSEFDSRVDYIMCTAFIALLKTGYKTNTNIIESLLELENYISQERQEAEDKAEDIRDKKNNIYFLIGAIAVSYFFIVNRLGHTAINFYWHTIEGQLVIAGSIMFSLIAIIAIILEENI